MSNKHVNHQHGLHTMNASRPKSKLRKRANKAKAALRKAPLLAALQEARYGNKKVTETKTTPAKKATTTKKKTVKTSEEKE